MTAAMVAVVAGLAVDLAIARLRRRTPQFFTTALTLCCVAGIGVGRGDLLPPAAAIALLGAFVLLWSALHRFVAFLAILLVTRPALDALRGAADSTGGDGSGPVAAMAGVALIAVAGPWLVLRWRAGLLRRPTAFVLGYAAFTVAGALSVISAGDRAAVAGEELRIVAALAMAFAVGQVVDTERIAGWLLAAVYGSTLVPFVVAAMQAATHGLATDAEGVGRVRGTFTHPNSFGLFLTLLIVFTAGLIGHVRGPARSALLAWNAAAVALLVLTLSRSAWAATLLGLTVIGVLQARRALVVGAVAVVAAATLVPAIGGRIADLDDSRSVTGGAGNSFVWRLDHWSATLPLVEQNPVTGVGLRMIPHLVDDAKVADNDYLRSLVETGAVGFIAYVATIGGLIRTARRRLHDVRNADGWPVGAAVGLAGVAGAFTLFSAGGNAISQVVVLWTLGALIACSTGFPALEPEARTPRDARTRRRVTPSSTAPGTQGAAQAGTGAAAP